MAIALRGTPTHIARTLQSGTEAYTITSTTAGDLLVATIALFNAEGAVVTGITGGGTWSLAKRGSGDANSHVEIWYAPNVSGGVTSISVTTNDDAVPQCDFEMDVLAFSGAATASPLDVAPTAGTGTSAAPAITSGTLAQADEVLIAIALHTGADATWAVDTGGGYTEISENEDNDNGQTYSSQYKVVASTASDTADWTLGASRDWTAILASFKGVASGDLSTVIGEPYIGGSTF